MIKVSFCLFDHKIKVQIVKGLDHYSLATSTTNWVEIAKVLYFMHVEIHTKWEDWSLTITKCPVSLKGRLPIVMTIQTFGYKSAADFDSIVIAIWETFNSKHMMLLCDKII